MQKLISRAMEIRHLFKKMEAERYGRSWTPAEVAQGFVGDVGDLQKLVMAKSGIRQVEDLDQKLEHELADCLWSVLVLADEYDIDIEKAFYETMADLEERIS